MLGRFVDERSEEQEERLLTTSLVPFRDATFEAGGGGCVVAVAYGAVERLRAMEPPAYDDEVWEELNERGYVVAEGEERETVAERFNALCLRLGGVKGVARLRLGRDHDLYAVGAPSQEQLAGAALLTIMIRDRIRRNRQRRVLEARLGEMDVVAA